MKLVLDAGALLAVERRDRDVIALMQAETAAGRSLVTHGGVVAQVWRGGGRQVMLARALRTIEIVSVGQSLGKQTGALLAESGTSDVVDAAVICIASDGDLVVTSDPDDLLHLADVAGADVSFVVV